MKKVLKFGCLGAIGFFLILVIAAFLVGDTEVQDSKVTQFSVQEDAESIAQTKETDSIKVVQKNGAIKELNSFRKKTDEFNDWTFYQDDRTPAYTNRNFIYPYIGQKDDYYWMRLRFQYTAEDWLFIDNVRIKTDSNDYSITGTFERDHNSEIWEWYDFTVEEKEIRMLEDIATSEVAKVRYEGQLYYKDRTLTSKKKDIIAQTLEIYKNLK